LWPLIHAPTPPSAVIRCVSLSELIMLVPPSQFLPIARQGFSRHPLAGLRIPDGLMQAPFTRPLMPNQRKKIICKATTTSHTKPEHCQHNPCLPARHLEPAHRSSKLSFFFLPHFVTFSPLIPSIAGWRVRMYFSQRLAQMYLQGFTHVSIRVESGTMFVRLDGVNGRWPLACKTLMCWAAS
jgi:hypothetical protein